MRANRVRVVHTKVTVVYSEADILSYLKQEQNYRANKGQRPYDGSKGLLLFFENVIEPVHGGPIGKLANAHL